MALVTRTWTARVARRLSLVAVLMKKLEVRHRIRSPAGVGKDVIDFHPLSIHEEQAAGWALPLLCLQESSDSRRDFRMASQAHTPIHPVPVLRAARALDLHMPSNRRPIVRVQAERAVGWLEDPAFPFIHSPVFARRPALFLVRMPVDCPGAEHRIEHVVDLREDARTGYMRVVLRPPDDQRVQTLDQRTLFRMTMAVDYLVEVVNMSLDSCFAGGDTRLEALQAASAILTCVRFPRRILPEVKPQEVEAGSPFGNRQGMGDPCLARLQLQSHRFQPC